MTSDLTNIFMGTELKLNINIEPIDEFTMDTYEWSADIYCSTKRVVTVAKKDAIKIDENNYVVLVDTSELGAGNIKCKITAYIPDYDFSDAVRTEVACIDTGINVLKNI